MHSCKEQHNPNHRLEDNPEDNPTPSLTKSALCL
ncbi:hypothetical protein CGRA01v4_15070 [Colletotrichum graminicola]|nr:hypothetical protein CGRA01v4_15070 [Colletotrichum graminicola]